MRPEKSRCGDKIPYVSISTLIVGPILSLEFTKKAVEMYEVPSDLWDKPILAMGALAITYLGLTVTAAGTLVARTSEAPEIAIDEQKHQLNSRDNIKSIALQNIYQSKLNSSRKNVYYQNPFIANNN